MPTETNAEQQYLARVRPVGVCSQSEWFDWQVERLVAKRFCGYDAADPFRNRIEEFGLGNFVLVPRPPKALDFADAMAKVELNGKTGRSYIDLRRHEDLDEVIATSSVMVDTDDGGGRLNTKPSVSRANILAAHRYPFYTWRGIVYAALFPWCLRGRGYDLVGSCCKSGGVPSLWLVDGGPELRAFWSGVAFPGWGAPSCGSIIVP